MLFINRKPPNSEKARGLVRVPFIVYENTIYVQYTPTLRHILSIHSLTWELGSMLCRLSEILLFSQTKCTIKQLVVQKPQYIRIRLT